MPHVSHSLGSSPRRRDRGGRMVRRGLAAVLAAVLVAAIPAGAQTDAERERDEARERQDQLAESIDVLQATDAQIDAALDELDAAIAAQQAAVDEALAVADAAARADREAQASLAAARRDVEVLQAAIREMAVAAYVHPPSADLVQSLQAESLSQALLQQAYLDARAHRDVDLLGLLRVAEQTAATRAEEAAEAATRAEAAVAAADVALDELEAERAREAAFASDLHVRIDGALAEAAALADLDATLSAQIAQEQAELIARIPPPTVPPTTLPPTTTTTTTTTTLVEDVTGSSTATTTTTTSTTAPADEEDEDEPTRPRTERPPLVTVYGFEVHAEIADDVAAMFDAAAADGFSFGGSAYRSTERQIELRIANCGPTEYDIWERPASTCRPPTAIPGRSLHEQGRALDLTFEGRLITSRSNAGFQWLAENAGTYGLRNLPSEPWHWSTTGG